MRVAPTIVLTEAERRKLTQWAKSRTASMRLARRPQMVLHAAMGESNEAIAEALGVGRVQVGRWRERYAKGGLAAIAQDRPRGGRPPRWMLRRCGRSQKS
jgi:predicted ArsR family transcriptional regulator